MFTKEMQRALKADAEKLGHLTGEDHNIVFLDEADDPVFVTTCKPCGGTGTKVVTVPRPDLGPGYFEVRVDNGSPTIVLTSPREFAFRLGEQGNKTDG